MELTAEQTAAARLLAVHELWRRGVLSWKLDSNQLAIYAAIFACASLQFVIEAARKIGKSFLLCLIGIETAERNPGKRINYGAPTGKEAAEIVLPVMGQLIADAPEDCKPVWKESKGHWEFPNGAYIVLFGCDDERAADRGRGPEAVLNIIDEAGFVPVLSYVLDSVLAPQTIQTHGRTLLGSTPPKSPAHEFCDIADAAVAIGAYITRDIYSHGRMTRAEIDEYLTQRATSRGLTLEQFKETTDFQREYGALRVLDSKLAVVPEFPRLRAEICIERPRPAFFTWYVSVDPGMGHKTGVLFALYDFRAAKLVVEHELLLSQAHTSAIAAGVKEVEKEHYQDLIRKPTRVVDDPHGRLVADLWHNDKLSFAPALKDHREEADANMRVWISRRRVLIHPRCAKLIHQLATGIKKPSGDLIETADGGHLDLLASLRYLVRSVDETTNPYPADYGFDRLTQVRRELPKEPDTLGAALLAGTNLGRRRTR